MLPKILFIEDSERAQESLKFRLAGRAEIVSACTHEEAWMKFAEHSGHLAAIVMDGSLASGKQFDTGNLVRQFRATFPGMIIAASGNEDYQDDLIAAGCTLKVSKIEVGAFLADWLEGGLM